MRVSIYIHTKKWEGNTPKYIDNWYIIDSSEFDGACGSGRFVGR